jgi:hypothetical protein
VTAKRIALRGLLASIIAIAMAYASVFLPGGAPTWSGWVMGMATPAALVSMMILGATRDGEPLGPLVWPFAFSGLVLAGGFAAALGLPASEAAGVALYGGLPLRAAVIIYGIGLLPIVVLPVAYAVTFRSQTLRPGDLERVREAAAAFRGGAPPTPSPSAEPELTGVAP